MKRILLGLWFSLIQSVVVAQSWQGGWPPASNGTTPGYTAPSNDRPTSAWSFPRATDPRWGGYEFRPDPRLDRLSESWKIEGPSGWRNSTPTPAGPSDAVQAPAYFSQPGAAANEAYRTPRGDRSAARRPLPSLWRPQRPMPPTSGGSMATSPWSGGPPAQSVWPERNPSAGGYGGAAERWRPDNGANRGGIPPGWGATYPPQPPHYNSRGWPDR